ncbi:MAG TPA: hypothetical protein VES79_14495 [Solirubrobacteraceae bacterium]|nr:hypothetical protein [Solirubrobacteraceae bacterium]
MATGDALVGVAVRRRRSYVVLLGTLAAGSATLSLLILPVWP